MTRTSQLRRPAFVATFALASTALLGACDVDRTMPGEMDEIVEPGETIGVEDFTENVEVPADESAEPTAQSCELIWAAANCLDGESASFCDLDFEAWDPTMNGEEFPMAFGACIPFDEVECWPGETREVETDCGMLEVGCSMWDGVPAWDPAECWEDGGGDTPLVLRFDDAPITMIASEATPAATFDIAMAADGNSCITTDWPSAATPWLAVDLDQNGNIDGGHELFGSGTSLAAGGKAEHGFIALAEFDQNRDGVVDARDPRFGELVLWRDHDGDRRSTPSELQPLVEAGVDSLSLDYRDVRSCDARGNCGIERASFGHAGGRGEIVDLHLACQ